MAKHRPHSPLEVLLQDERWCRTLARRLAGDAGDDLLQDAWLAAVRRAPTGNARAWFRAVLRHLLAQEYRRTGRRTRREKHAAQNDHVHSTAEDAERIELYRRLTCAVLELAEPYRSTVVRRFFDHESAQAIATRDNIPASTVRNRLRRALGQLRARLTDEYDGDPRALVALPLLWRQAAQDRWRAWRKPLLAATVLAAVSTATQAAVVDHPEPPALVGPGSDGQPQPGRDEEARPAPRKPDVQPHVQPDARPLERPDFPSP